KPYVMDFGVARELSAPGLTATGDIVGTPQFMAPEQARGREGHGPRADVYGLGATLYALLAGRPPFEGTVAEVLTQLLAGEPPPPLRRRAPGVAPDLEIITMRCLEADPARRYDSAAALADDLARHLAGEPIRARRASLAH